MGDGGRVVVWIPSRTPDEYQAWLPTGIEVREAPARGGIPDAPQQADVLVTGFDPRRVLEMLPGLRGLRLVQTLTAGVDTVIDHVPPGVVLCDASGVHDASVSEWVVLATLAMRRHLPDCVLSQRDAVWRWSKGGADLEGATVLILGHGSIGRALEQRLRPFGARVVRVARHARADVHGVEELPRLLGDADVVAVLLPLTAETRGMVDARFLAAMHDGAILVNAARGPIVDTDALLAELATGRIRAALDVTDPEPLPDGHPLWSAPGVLITPHIGGNVERLLERAWRFAADQVHRFVEGRPLRNIVSDGY